MRCAQNCLWSIALLLASTAVCAAQDKTWMQFRGPGGLGISSEKNLPVKWSPTENIAWKSPLPGSGASSPIIVGERIYLTAFTGYNVPGQAVGAQENLKLHLVCLNRADGKLLWTKDVEPKLPEQPRMREGHGYASSTPVSDGAHVYVYFGKTGVFCFDLDGKQQWRADVGSGVDGFGSGSSPVLNGDFLYVNAAVESKSLIALNKKTGKEAWRAGGIEQSWSMPILVTAPGGKKELALGTMTRQNKILGFDPETGQLLWSCLTDIAWYHAPSMISHDGVIYALAGRAGIVGLAIRAGGRGDVTKTHRLWTSKKGSNVSSPIYHEGRLYWMNDATGTAFCADSKTGEVLYEEAPNRPGQVYASPILADGKIYYLTRDGRTFVVAASPKFELLATNSVAGQRDFNQTPVNASPIAHGGRIYIRTDRHLYAIGAK